MLEDVMYEKEMKGTRCKTCLYRKNFGVQKTLSPCCSCRDRPDRYKDKSEYVPQYDNKELQDKVSNERSGKFDY
jgi:hypothetical protein